MDDKIEFRSSKMAVKMQRVENYSQNDGGSLFDDSGVFL